MIGFSSQFAHIWQGRYDFGLPMRREWRNWQTRQLEVLVGVKSRGGSSPLSRIIQKNADQLVGIFQFWRCAVILAATRTSSGRVNVSLGIAGLHRLPLVIFFLACPQSNQHLDPAIHEAMSQQPTDEAEPGTVLQEFERGYMIHDRLLRPARVIVAAAPPEAPKEQPAESSEDASGFDN